MASMNSITRVTCAVDGVLGYTNEHNHQFQSLLSTVKIQEGQHKNSLSFQFNKNYD